jgi:hypothetical protein
MNGSGVVHNLECPDPRFLPSNRLKILFTAILVTSHRIRSQLTPVQVGRRCRIALDQRISVKLDLLADFR